MTITPTPTEDLSQFDAICAGVGEWEPLPTVMAEPAQERDLDQDEIDAMILAVLVCPHG